MNTNGRMSECVRRENEKMVKRGGGGFRAQRRMKRKEMVRRFLCQIGGLGPVWHAVYWSEMDYLVPEVTIMSSFNLKPLKPASNLLNLQNILGFTIPS